MKTKLRKSKKSIKTSIDVYVEPLFNDLYDCYLTPSCTVNSTATAIRVNY